MTALMDLLEKAAPSKAEMYFLPSGERIPFDEIWRRSEDVARAIRHRVGGGGAVASVLTTVPECIPNVFGIWLSGNDLVSLPHPGRGASIERYQTQIEFMLETAGVSLLLVDSRFLPLIPELSVPVVSFDEMLQGGPPSDVTGSGDLVQFTSGSVGQPKGVRLTQEAVGENIMALIDHLAPEPGDNSCSWLPLSHDMGLIGMFLTPTVCMNADIVGTGMMTLIDPQYFLANPQVWLDTCSLTGATITTAPNFAMGLAARARSLHGPLDLSKLRCVITGAERVSVQTLRQFSDAFADAGFNSSSISPAYGLAENTLAVTMIPPEQHWSSIRLDREALAEGYVVQTEDEGSIEYVGNGGNLKGVEVRIDAPPGKIGEVQMRSAGMLSDYVGADLKLTDDQWFPTRDVGFLHDDELYLVGRSDDTIIVAGKNHYAADVETAIEHPGVRSGNLAAVPEDVGYSIVLEPAGNSEPEALEPLCREVAAVAGKATGIRPNAVTVVPRGSLLKTPSGKLQRTLIGRSLASGDLVSLSTIRFGASAS